MAAKFGRHRSICSLFVFRRSPKPHQHNVTVTASDQGKIIRLTCTSVGQLTARKPIKVAKDRRSFKRFVKIQTDAPHQEARRTANHQRANVAQNTAFIFKRPVGKALLLIIVRYARNRPGHQQLPVNPRALIFGQWRSSFRKIPENRARLLTTGHIRCAARMRSRNDRPGYSRQVFR